MRLGAGNSSRRKGDSSRSGGACWASAGTGAVTNSMAASTPRRGPEDTLMSCLPVESLEPGQRHPDLPLVFARLVPIAPLADVVIVRLEEQYLADALVRVDASGEGRRVRDLQRDVPFPLGLERRHVGDDPAARVRTLPYADRQHIPRNPEILDRACQREAVR